jgi:transcriptional regulator with XRE-family HTH domain
MTEAAMFADPLRAYVVTLRKGRKITQAELAQRIGMGERTYVSWERGSTKSIKEHFARAIISALDGSREHLDMLDQMNPAEAQQLAHEWMSLSSEERLKAESGLRQVRRIVELSDADPSGAEEVIQQLLREAREDPAILTWLAGFLAGRRGPQAR